MILPQSVIFHTSIAAGFLILNPGSIKRGVGDFSSDVRRSMSDGLILSGKVHNFGPESSQPMTPESSPQSTSRGTMEPGAPGGVMVDSGIRGILREELQKLLVPIARDIDVIKSDLSATSEEVAESGRQAERSC